MRTQKIQKLSIMVQKYENLKKMSKNHFFSKNIKFLKKNKKFAEEKKFRIRETKNLSTDADSSTTAKKLLSIVG